MSLHLTRIRYARPVLRDTQATHRALAHAVEGVPGRWLWAAPLRDLLIVQGPAPVPVDDLAAIAPITESGTSPVPDIDEGPARLSLIAHPTRSVARPGGRGVRTPLPIDQAADWLARKLADAVELDQVDVQPLGTHRGRRLDGNHPAHHLVGLTATATVTDPDRLAELRAAGIGPGKAYGAGLLIVSAA